jgi:hypothetical protein
MPMFRYECSKCGHQENILVRPNQIYKCPADHTIMYRMLPSNISSTTYITGDTHRGTQVKKNLNKQLKERMTKHHDKYEIEEKIDKYGTDDAQQHGWFKKRKKM